MRLVRIVWSVVLTLLLFVMVYAPAFALLDRLHLTVDAKVPGMIAVSLVLACVLMGFAIHRGWLSPADFGWQWPSRRYLLYALLLSVPLSALLTIVLVHVDEPGPLIGLRLTQRQAYLCFALAAPVQEEAIFRGLLQSSFAKGLGMASASGIASGIAASLAIAMLFGAVHLVVGPVTAMAALVLGVLAGELKRRSGSLLPGMLCHAVFNLGGLLLAAG